MAGKGLAIGLFAAAALIGIAAIDNNWNHRQATHALQDETPAPRTDGIAPEVLAMMAADAAERKRELSPRYSVREKNGLFDYEREPSSVERANGQTAAPMVRVRYLGRDEADFAFGVISGAYEVVARCDEPCEFVTVTPWLYPSASERFRVTPDSIYGAMIHDARNGLLGEPLPVRREEPTPAVPASQASTMPEADISFLIGKKLPAWRDPPASEPSTSEDTAPLKASEPASAVPTI